MAWSVKAADKKGSVQEPGLADIMSEQLARRLQREEDGDDDGGGGFVDDVSVAEADAAAAAAATPGAPEDAEQYVRDEELARALQQAEEDDELMRISQQQQQRKKKPTTTTTTTTTKKALVTKHDPEVSARRNAAALQARFAEQDAELGDFDEDDFAIPNPAYNALKERTRRDATRAARRRGAASAASAAGRSGGGGGARSDAVLDDATRLTLLGLLNTGVVAQIGGVVGQGKEARIFHATAPDGRELAVKVFRSSGELRSRVEYADGELLRELQRPRPHGWRVVRLWAQRELRNLAAMQPHLRCPEALGLYGGNVLVMQFVGADGVPASTLHEAAENGLLPAGKTRLRKAFTEVALAIHAMFCRAGVVHADLSEFNMLFDGARVWIIDVAQSVSSTHRNAIPFLRRDCAAVVAFFRRRGLVSVLSARELFLFASDETLADDDEEAAKLEGLMAAADKRGAPSREQVAEDDDFAKSDFGNRPEVSAVVAASKQDGDEVEIALLAPDGEEDEEVLEFLAEQLTGEAFPLGTLSDGTVLSANHRKSHMRACFPRIRELGLSHVARLDGEICGALLVDDLSAPPPTETSADLSWMETLGPIAEMNAAAKAPIIAEHPAPGEIAYLSWVGVGPAARSRGVMRQLVEASLCVAKDRGFKRALCVAVSMWASKALANVGFKEVHRVPYATFEIARMPATGAPGKPFSNVQQPHVAAVTMQKLLQQ